MAGEERKYDMNAENGQLHLPCVLDSEKICLYFVSFPLHI